MFNWHQTITNKCESWYVKVNVMFCFVWFKVNALQLTVLIYTNIDVEDVVIGRNELHFQTQTLKRPNSCNLWSNYFWISMVENSQFQQSYSIFNNHINVSRVEGEMFNTHSYITQIYSNPKNNKLSKKLNGFHTFALYVFQKKKPDRLDLALRSLIDWLVVDNVTPRLFTKYKFCKMFFRDDLSLVASYVDITLVENTLWP